VLIENQADAEARTYYSEEMHQRFLDAGFYRTYMPRRYGGLEFDVRTMTRLHSSWRAATCRRRGASGGQQPRAAGRLVVRRGAQAEAFAAPSSGLRRGRADGHGHPGRRRLEINGTIGYCSGIPYSNWYMGQAIMPGETPPASRG
jgi:3-hydroxy-9,10-secoandrosta-1,3,5(10)-triene-9,17-dione monooxygenase